MGRILTFFLGRGKKGQSSREVEGEMLSGVVELSKQRKLQGRHKLPVYILVLRIPGGDLRNYEFCITNSLFEQKINLRNIVPCLEIFFIFAASSLKIASPILGDGRHIIKTLSYVLSAVYRTSQLLFLLRGKAMVNAYVFVYYANGISVCVAELSIPLCTGVGFVIAYLQQGGNAKALYTR